jgi:hypothetical protein
MLVFLADVVFVDDYFLAKLKSAYSSCPYFSDEIKARWKGHGLIKSSGGLCTYHDMLVIPRPTQDIRILLLTEYHDNDGHPNWRHLLASLLKCLCWERMSFNSKNYCSNCVVCNRVKPNRLGSAYLSPLGVFEYPWEIVGMDFVTDYPAVLNYNTLLF